MTADPLVDIAASERQYADHLAAVVDALGGDVGTWWAWRGARTYGHDHRRPPKHGPPILVASFKDARAVRPRPSILLQHGAGQTYDADPNCAGHPSYTGGRGRHGIILHLCPNPDDAAKVDGPAAVVGCPKLDRHQNLPPRPRRVVTFSWHADVSHCPEARWAWPHYRQHFPAIVQRLRDDGWTVLGHAHPRMWTMMAKVYAKLGIEAVADFDDVVRRTGTYVVDNSSTLFEAAALNIPVVALNAPTYRRHVHHGLRFWDLVPGPQADHPDEVLDAVDAAQHPSWVQVRRRVAEQVYAVPIGQAAQTAAEAIRAHLGADGAP